MQESDIAAVLRVQSECYGISMNESEQTLRSRLAVAPDSSWLAEDAHGVPAYLVAYRSMLGKVTALGGLFGIAAQVDCLYLHDLAVCQRAKGQGLGPWLVRHAWKMALAEGLQHSALVSVQDTQSFWRKLGYADFDDLQPDEHERLTTYGSPCQYMARRL